MRLKHLVYAWPLLFVWPIVLVWRGPVRQSMEQTPFKLGSQAFLTRDSRQVRNLVDLLKGKLSPAKVKGCMKGHKLLKACEPALFTYLLSWQGDPSELLAMKNTFQSDRQARAALAFGCQNWYPPSSLGAAMKNANMLWQKVCGWGGKHAP